jgi:hypothetical protein
VLVLDSPPTKLDISDKYLLAFQEDTKVCIADVELETKGIIELYAQDNENAKFLDAYLDSNHAMVLYGNPFNPTFEKAVI